MQATSSAATMLAAITEGWDPGEVRLVALDGGSDAELSSLADQVAALSPAVLTIHLHHLPQRDELWLSRSILEPLYNGHSCSFLQSDGAETKQRSIYSQGIILLSGKGSFSVPLRSFYDYSVCYGGKLEGVALVLQEDL